MSDLPPVNTPEKEKTLHELIYMINSYVNAIEACGMHAAIFPEKYKEIYKEMEDYALKYMDAIDAFLSTYEKEKATNNVVSLAYTKYYKQLKKHKANGYIL